MSWINLIDCLNIFQLNFDSLSWIPGVNDVTWLKLLLVDEPYNFVIQDFLIFIYYVFILIHQNIETILVKAAVFASQYKWGCCDTDTRRSEQPGQH